MAYRISVKKDSATVGRAGTMGANVLAKLVGLTNVKIETETEHTATLSYDADKPMADEIERLLAEAHLESVKTK